MNVDIEALTARAAAFRVAVPSWGVGTGGTRFARFPGPGEPRNIFEKLEDCEVVLKLVQSTPGVSLHIPWDRAENAPALRMFAESRGLVHRVDELDTRFRMNRANTTTYKYGSLAHVDATVRRQAVEHNLECLQIGLGLGARSHTVYGLATAATSQANSTSAGRSIGISTACARSTRSCRPAGGCFSNTNPTSLRFYSTVLGDWGTSYYCASALGPRAFSLVDLGHHVPNTNIEQIVARLIQFGKLGGFHFNDSKLRR